jgi:TRAP-type C4-dicarboxylate transport system permease small subunit
MSRIAKFNDALFSGIETGIAVLLYGLTGAAFIQLAMRYLLKYSWAGIDELTRLAFVWVVSIGGALAFRKKAHVGITFLSGKLSGRNKLYLELFVTIMLLAFMTLIVVAGIHMAQLGTMQLSEYLQISMAFFYLCIPVGAALSILVFIEEITALLPKMKERTE